jgi:hypothetical protein
MAIWPFNRNQNQSTDLPQEVQDYYKSESKGRTGVAGLLALGTLGVTVLLALGLFFGGRWAYRTAFKDDKAQPAQVAQQPADQSEEEPSDDSQAPGTDTQPEPTPQPAKQTPTPATTLPNTGPSDAIIIAFSAVFFATAWYYVFGNKKAWAKNSSLGDSE